MAIIKNEIPILEFDTVLFRILSGPKPCHIQAN